MSRWAIRVTFANGEDAFLHHGSRIGEGPLATFATRKLADMNAEMIQHGLDAGDTVTVVKHYKSDPVVPAGREPSGAK